MPYKPRKYFTKKVVVKPKVHWSLYKRHDEVEISNPTSGGVQYKYGKLQLVSASTDTNYQPGLTKKIKHLKIEVTRPAIDSESAKKIQPTLLKSKLYVLYLPQGVSFTESAATTDNNKYLSETLISHPEWIMAERNLNATIFNGDVSTSSTTSCSVKLSRNLRSGDQIYCVIANLYDTSLFGSNAAVTKAFKYRAEFSFAACV